MDDAPGLRPPVAIITTSPTNFAGAATIHSRLLILWSAAGFDVTLVTRDIPFLYDELVAADVRVEVVTVKSDAYPESDAIATLGVASEMYRCGLGAHKAGCPIVLCASYLFPFFEAVVKARLLLARDGIPAGTIAIPAGSDVWQIGSQCPEVVASLLSQEHCDAVSTYSKRFSREVLALAERKIVTDVIPPPLELSSFSPPTREGRSAARQSLGIAEDSFIMLQCSNMRPVKRLDVSVELARSVANRLKREVVLLLVGPDTEHLRQAIGQGRFPVDTARGRYQDGPLRLVQCGLARSVAPYHHAADVAINTSIHDSFNVSIAESMACALPVVCTNTAGVMEIAEGQPWVCPVRYAPRAVDAFRAGRVPAPDPSSMRRACRFLAELAERPTLGVQMGKRARKAIGEACGPDRVLSKWAALLDRVVSAVRLNGSLRLRPKRPSI